jgi:hypothetical protein
MINGNCQKFRDATIKVSKVMRIPTIPTKKCLAFYLSTDGSNANV